MEIINLFLLDWFEKTLKVAWKNFRKILKNSEIFLTGDEKGGKIRNIKKESRKRMIKRQAVTMNQNFYFSYFR